jgi:outer membrane lipoprotein-sorting protein
MMKKTIQIVIVGLIGTLGMGAWADDPAISWVLKDAMRQVDRQADNFESAMSRVEIIRKSNSGDEETETGIAFFHERGDIRVSAETPVPRVYLLDGSDLYRYLPTEGVVEEYYLPKHPQMLATYLRLGFSTTGRDLEEDYLVSAIGERFIGDRRTLGLDLTPKREKDRDLVAGIKLWIDQASWMPVEQVIEAPSTGHTMTVRYSNMARNLKLNPDLFKRDWPRGTEARKVR